MIAVEIGPVWPTVTQGTGRRLSCFAATLLGRGVGRDSVAGFGRLNGSAVGVVGCHTPWLSSGLAFGPRSMPDWHGQNRLTRFIRDFIC